MTAEMTASEIRFPNMVVATAMWAMPGVRHRCFLGKLPESDGEMCFYRTLLAISQYGGRNRQS